MNSPEDAHAAFVPADEGVSRRLLDQHDVVIDACGGSLLQFPFDLTRPGLKILESGTADGHWLHQLSLLSPDPHVNSYVGTDINPRFFPKQHSGAFRFYAHNVAEAWPADEHGQYDIVHQRLSLPGAAPGSLSVAVKNLFALVKPGGYLQLVEAEQTGPQSGPVFAQFLDLVKLVFDTMGAGVTYASDMGAWVEGAGAMDVTETCVDMAFGAAHSDSELAEKGATCTAGAVAGLVMHAKQMGLQDSAGTSEADLNSLADRLLAELRRSGAHYPLRIVWGRKAGAADSGRLGATPAAAAPAPAPAPAPARASPPAPV